MTPIKSPIKDNDDDDDASDFVSSRKGKNRLEITSTVRRTGGRGTRQVSPGSGIGKRTLLTRRRESDPEYY